MSEHAEIHEAAVLSRYGQGAKAREDALCCPVDYDRRYLEVLPPEILERDYGCGDPSRYVAEGEVVLDLGSGAGKICWIAAQIVGRSGRVIGLDMNSDMLTLARQHHADIAARIGFDNVTFHRAMIQDLRLDLDRLDAELRRNPVAGADAWMRLRQLEDHLRQGHPLVADDSVDVVLSNCVLNLVRPSDKPRLFAEIHRVVRPGGRVVISDIVADEDVPMAMQQDPELWSGCISGAYREDSFLDAFTAAGFHGVELLKRDPEPWRTVEGIEFRSVTVRAYKRENRPCLERNQAVIYRGPFAQVHDEEGHLFVRGERTAVCDRTFDQLQRAPYAGQFEPVEPRLPVADAEAQPWPRRERVRAAWETKGREYRATTAAAGDCCPPPIDGQSSGCC